MQYNIFQFPKLLIRDYISTIARIHYTIHATMPYTFKRINIRNPVEIPGRDSIERKVITK